MKINEIITEDIDPVTGEVLPGSKPEPDPVTSASDNSIQQEKKDLYSFLRAVENWWNANNDRDSQIDYRGPGMRVWTRGDGTRHRDPARFYAYKNADDVMNRLWNALSKMKGAKIAGTVSGEFGSSAMKPAISFRGFILVKYDNTIEVMSRSRITNKNSVWRHQAPTTESADSGNKVSRSVLQRAVDQYWHEEGYVGSIRLLASVFDRRGYDGLDVYNIVTLDEDSGMYIINELDINPKDGKVVYISPTPIMEFSTLDEAKRAIGYQLTSKLTNPAYLGTSSSGSSPRERFMNTPGEQAKQSRISQSAYSDSFGGDSGNYTR